MRSAAGFALGMEKFCPAKHLFNPKPHASRTQRPTLYVRCELNNVLVPMTFRDQPLSIM